MHYDGNRDFVQDARRRLMRYGVSFFRNIAYTENDMSIRKYYLHIELAAIICCLALAPLRNSAVQELRFSVRNLAVIFYIIMLYFLCRKHNLLYRKTDMIMHISEGTVAFGLLTLVSSVIELLLVLRDDATAVRLHIETSFAYHIMAAAALSCAALYEEILYRFYLPEMLRRVTEKLPQKARLVLSELIPLLLFSAAHHYLGVAAVANALCAGIVLRRCAAKTGSPFPSAAAHALYNVAVYALCSRLI